MNYRMMGTVADSMHAANTGVDIAVVANTVAADSTRAAVVAVVTNTAVANTAVVVADNSREEYKNRWRIAGHHVLATVTTTTWSKRLDRSDVPQTSRTVLRSGP